MRRIKKLLIILFVILLSGCFEETESFDVVIVFDTQNDSICFNNNSVILSRLNYNNIVVNEVNDINDSTKVLTLNTSLDTITLKNIIESKGEIKMEEAYSQSEIYRTFEQIYSKVFEFNIIPVKEDSFFHMNHADFTNILLKPYLSDTSFYPVVGRAEMKNIPMIDSILNNKKIKALFPENLLLKWSFEKYANEYELIAIRKCDSLYCFSNEWIKTANYTKVKKHFYEVQIQLDENYNDLFLELSTRNVNKSLPFTLDDKVVCYPRMTGIVYNGNISLKIDMDEKQMKSFVTFLNSDPLTCKVKCYLNNYKLASHTYLKNKKKKAGSGLKPN
jgi:hypothetical protein